VPLLVKESARLAGEIFNVFLVEAGKVITWKDIDKTCARSTPEFQKKLSAVVRVLCAAGDN
jgi:hypothetical protein